MIATATLMGCAVPATFQRASYYEFSEYGDYLADNYGIRFDGPVSQEAYREAVGAIFADAGSVAVPAEIDQEGFSALEAVLTTLYIADLDELGDTYPEAKVAELLAAWPGAPADLPLERRHELAAAIDSGLLNPGWRNVDLSQPPPAGFATDLLGNALQLTGSFKNFLARAAESDITNQLIFSWRSTIRS
jgi:hypothetical protein